MKKLVNYQMWSSFQRLQCSMWVSALSALRLVLSSSHCYLMYMHTKKLIRWWFWNPLFALHINCLPASSISLLKHSSEVLFWHAQLQKLKKRSQPIFCIQAKQKNENQRGISEKKKVIIITNSFWFVFPTENKPYFFYRNKHS